MTEYVNPEDVEPGRAGTATVRGVKGVRLWRSGLTLAHVWMSASELPPDRWDSGLWHKHSDITDLVLDPLPGEAPVDSVVITREHLANWEADPKKIRVYARYLHDEGRPAGGQLLRLIADKLDTLPKPVPPEPNSYGSIIFANGGNGDREYFIRALAGYGRVWVGDGGGEYDYDQMSDVEVIREGIS